MGRDFARKGSQKKQNSSSSHWPWLFAGTFIGIVISAIAFFKLFPVIYPHIAHLEKAPVVAEKTVAPKVSSTRTPQFDFYSLLPELEVVVPEHAESLSPAIAESVIVTTPESSDKTYRLQLGSFQKYEDADRLKAQMALSGIQVEIEAVTLEGNKNWYRVRSIPFQDRASAESVRSQLQAQSIQSLLVEDKG